MAEAQGGVVLAEVDPDHESAAAHLSDLGIAGDLAEQLAQQPDLRLQAQQRAARSSKASRLASAAAQASGLPVKVWPWKNVRHSSGAPRNASYTRSVVSVAASGR